MRAGRSAGLSRNSAPWLAIAKEYWSIYSTPVYHTGATLLGGEVDDEQGTAIPAQIYNALPATNPRQRLVYPNRRSGPNTVYHSHIVNVRRRGGQSAYDCLGAAA